jgi:hypothetical protein
MARAWKETLMDHIQRCLSALTALARAFSIVGRSAPAAGGVVMRRRIGLLVSLVALLALGGGMLAATPAWAAPPKHFQIPLNSSFHNDRLSAACGFDVNVVTTGNLDVTLLYDQSGTLIKEVDTYPAFAYFITAPSTGVTLRSSSPAVVHVDYTGGGAVGTSAVVSESGLQFMVQHGVMFTGRQVFDAVVVDQSPEGIPEYEPGDLIFQSGNFFPGDDVPLACAALSGPQQG